MSLRHPKRRVIRPRERIGQLPGARLVIIVDAHAHDVPVLRQQIDRLWPASSSP